MLALVLYRYFLITRNGNIAFVWVPGHADIIGNSAAESAAKDVLEGDVSDELIPFPDIKPRVNNVRALEWDKYPHNKLQIIFSKAE